MMFKSFDGLAPVYLHEFRFSERRTHYDLRDSFRKLNLPKPRTNYLKRSFSYSGALLSDLSNSLPENIRAIQLDSLRRKSRTWNIRFPLGNQFLGLYEKMWRLGLSGSVITARSRLEISPKSPPSVNK